MKKANSPFVFLLFQLKWYRTNRFVKQRKKSANTASTIVSNKYDIYDQWVKMAFLIVQCSHLEKDEIKHVDHTIHKHKFQMEQRLASI